jgi:multidrug efflux pump subunit AcrB
MDIKDQKGHKSTDYLYLEKLKFNPELRKGWLNFFIVNFRVVILMMALITLWGVYSFNDLPRESDPEVKIPIAVVSTVYPGVSPADMEELVTKKIEKKIAGIKGIKKITSNSANSISSITVEFDAKEDLDGSIRKLRDQVNSVKSELPADAKDPVVMEISLSDQPVWTISLSGPYDGFTLKKYADDIKDNLEKIPGVREVTVTGGDDKQFEIAYDPQKLAYYNFTADQANQAVKALNLVIPSGNFEGDKYNYPLKADGRFFDIKKLQDLPIFHTDKGAIVYLKDVAAVSEKPTERTSYSRLSSQGSQPESAVIINVVKKTGGSIIDIVKECRTTVETKLKSYPAELHYQVAIDYSADIEENFTQLSHDFLLTLILVFGVLLLIVGFKEALIAGLAVPLVFFITFGTMLLNGISLNFLSMFSLILSLGLLVDDAIVVVSATKQYIRTGKFTPEEAVLLVLNDFKVVLTTTTLTTVWAFLPLLSSTGIMGEYIKSIPITVSTTLIASLLVALMINHPLAAVLERLRITKQLFFLGAIAETALAVWFFTIGQTWSWIGFGILLVIMFISWKWYLGQGRKKLTENKILMDKEWADDELIKARIGGEDDNAGGFWQRFSRGIIHLDRFLPIYEKYLRLIVSTRQWRIKAIAGVFGLLVIAVLLPITGIVKMEFFPASDNKYIFIDVTAPIGLKLEETDAIMRQAETKLVKYKEIENFTTETGQPSAYSSGRSSSYVGSITVNLVDKKERKIKSYDLAKNIREDFKSIVGADFTVDTPSGGPPSGSAFEAQIMGDDLQTLDKIANDLKKTLAAIPGAVNADVSLKESPADYTFALDPQRLELYDLNAAMVGSTLRLAISGSEITTVIRDGKEISVNARFDKTRIPDLAAVGNLQIKNMRGESVFLKDVAKIELRPSVESIMRIDQKRTVILSASVEGKTRPQAVLDEFQKKAKSYQLPAGYNITYGGENETNTESVMSIIRAMAIAGLLIVSTLVVQFNSFRKTLVVLVAIPLALIGVFFGMALTGVPLSFPGLIGILALFGIVVKNSIILVDKINLNLKSGIPFIDAVVDAGKSRFEAIFITSICTIFGLVPVTLSNEMWLGLGGAVIFGLITSSFFTLFIVPTLFVSVAGKRERENMNQKIITVENP